MEHFKRNPFPLRQSHNLRQFLMEHAASIWCGIILRNISGKKSGIVLV